MLTRKSGMQLKMHFVTIEDLVPAEHLLRQIDKMIDFSFIYDEVQHLYCKNNGRPGIDPVIWVKYLLIGFLYGISSERRIEQEIQVNNAYRWFLSLDLEEKIPNHSTISQLRRRKLNGTDLFRNLFEHILNICVEKDFLALETEGKIAPVKKRPIFKEKPKTVQKTISTTDPDAGLLNRPSKPGGMHYLDHQSIDAKHGIIVDVAVTPGNVSDCIPYLERIEYMENTVGLDIEAVGVDSGYDTSLSQRNGRTRNHDLYTGKRYLRHPQSRIWS